MWDGDKQKQIAGDNALQMQVKGDLIVGVTANEARQIALDVFKANFFDLSIEAKQKAEERVAEITDQVIERLYSEVPDKVHKIKDPDIQYSLFNVQKEYARIGDTEVGENLVVALIDKIKIDNRNSESFVIDDALQILTKLSNANLALLSMIVFAKLNIPINGRKEFKAMLGKLTPIINDITALNNLDMSYLKQSGCVYGTINISVNSSLVKSLRKEYEYFYRIALDNNTQQQLVFKHTQNDIQKQIKLFSVYDFDEQRILGLKFSNEKRYNDAIVDNNAFFEDWVKSFCEEYLSTQTEKDDNEIIQFHASINDGWLQAFETMNSQQVKSFNLNPVGLYIGALYLGKTIGIKIPIDIFYPSN